MSEIYNYDHYLSFEELGKYHHKFNEKLQEIAKKEELLLIDLASQVPSNNQYIYDLVHLNAKGSVLTANIISKEIKNKYEVLLRQN
jgi:lysophospholipase L1-like esterase